MEYPNRTTQFLKIVGLSTTITLMGLLPFILPPWIGAQTEETETAEVSETESEPSGERDSENTDEAVDESDAEGTEADQEGSTDEDSEEPDESSEEVEELKERVESTVDNLQDANLTTFAGFVTSFEGETLTIDADGSEVSVEIDAELTIYYQIESNSTDEIDADEIETGDYVLVSGPKIGNTVTANAVYRDTAYISRTGSIIELNEDDFFITVQTLDKDTYTIDIEQSTTQQLLNIKSFELETAGFSKMKTGDTIQFVIARSAEDQDRYSAVKTIVIPQEYFIKESGEEADSEGSEESNESGESTDSEDAENQENESEEGSTEETADDES